jgi:prepilin-type N-terminal cleavage/methylation domain-containing protein
MRPRNSCSRRHRQGFTLTELLIGLTIMGVILAASAPAISNSMRMHKLRSAATQMQSALVKARSSAVTKGATIRIDLWPAAGLTLTREDSDNDGFFDAVLGWNWMPRGIQMTSADFSGSRWVTFTPNGVPSAPGTILVRAGTGELRQIRVAAGSGAVTIEEPSGAEAVN